MRNARIPVLVLLVFTAVLSGAEAKLFTIVHTNDMHSHVQGFAPEIDYTPLSVNDDLTAGGWSRIATIIARTRSERKNPVLVIDAGDFLMGSLFHMVSRERGFELSLMKAMGYDAVGLGNHEFDLMPDGLARILVSARAKGGMPQPLFSSAVFSADSAKDDSLAELFANGTIKQYEVIEKNGVRIGVFAIIGKDAAEVSPFASPVKFRKPAEAAKEMVTLLREREKADIVVCVSHSGLSKNSAKSEDEILAKEVPGIDIILSGHTHTKIEKPIQVGSTIIVQAWAYGKEVGVLDFSWDAGKVELVKWRPVEIDDSIPGNPKIQAAIEREKREIDDLILREHGLSYATVLAETDADMASPLAESGLGNMITDSIRWYVDTYDSDPNDPSSKVAFAVESNGVIRDDLARGRTGKIGMADLFRVLPLGIGMDGTMGYPLISVYLTASEIKKTLEVLTSVYPLKGSDYFLQISGVRFTYNPRRMLFDRVTEIWLGSEEEGFVPLDYSPRNTRLYRVAANMYNSAFLKMIGGFTYGILNIVPKYRDGTPIDDLATARVDADKKAPGIQELKEWVGLVEYVRGFSDSNANGIPDIPTKYKAPRGRIVSRPSWSPVSLLSHGTRVTWVAFGVILFVLLLVAGLVVLIVRLSTRGRRRGRRARA